MQLLTHTVCRSYREEQCSEFNNKIFERNYYEWIPYLKAPRKCELNCMPRGERFYYRHAAKVSWKPSKKVTQAQSLSKTFKEQC